MNQFMQLLHPGFNLQRQQRMKRKKTAGYIPAENVPGGSVMFLNLVTVMVIGYSTMLLSLSLLLGQ
ncbi:hypothetical protein [Paenibacillus sp. PCH8]|uniref:hypothetical protein n=1 Tax=Paenibacillus sp. PCH8 TaxID=2066524 RepID=UPI0011B0CA22|nr:hypothetical protein [Paenibacillus sp. PCH8]